MKKIGYSLLDILPFLALLVSLLPFFALGFPDGHDSIYGLVRVAEFKSSMENGQFPPYWAENLYGGYGSPIFLFYAPLFLFISTVFSVMVGSIAGGMISAIIMFSWVAVVGVRLMLEAALGEHTFGTEAASRVAVYFFILNPYLLGDVFLRNAFSEYVALCLSPFALYGLLDIRHRPLVGGLILTTSLALIILAHNLMALIITSLILAAVLVLYPRSESETSWRIIFGIGLSLGLAVFYWLPALYYLPLVRGDLLVSGYGDFRNNFPSLKNVFGHQEFFSAGLLTPLALIVAAGTLLFTRVNNLLPNRRFLMFSFGGSLFFLFLQTRISLWIWETMPFMPYFQFPWRMTGPLTLLTSIVAGISFAQLCRGSSRKIVAIRELLFFFFCILNAIPHIRAVRPLPHEISGQLSRIVAADNIKNLGLSATYSDEYLPRVADPNRWRIERPTMGPVVRTSSPIELRVQENIGTRIILETHEPIPTTLHLGRWAFTGWTCRINGELCSLGSNSMGGLKLPVSAGLNRIILELQPPVLRRISAWVSLASFAAWTLAVIVAARKKGSWGIESVGSTRMQDGSMGDGSRDV